MSLIYLAAAYSHPDPFIRQERFDTVTAVAGKIMQRHEHMVFSPITHSHPIAVKYDFPSDWETWADFDTRIISTCDELWVLQTPGWRTSKGVASEIELALMLMLPVYLCDVSGTITSTFQAAMKAHHEQGTV